MIPSADKKWLLIFYSVPSKPVSNRIRLWRKLSKTGAVQLKGSMYILPFSDEHYELFEWLITEVTSMGGEGAFVRVDSVETLSDADIRGLFIQQREKDYRGLDKKLEDLARKLQSFRKGTRPQNPGQLGELVARLKKEFEEIRAVDFFSSKAGELIAKRIKALDAEIKGMAAPGVGEKAVLPAPRRTDDYQGRTWVTRKKPFVDRMASAWLIKRFIDTNAVFGFIEEQEIGSLGKGTVPFDVREGEFTHHGDFCTFEVLVKAFRIKDKDIRIIAEIVHDLDLKDEKYGRRETSGIEEVLSGIRKTAKDDRDALEKGMAIFEMLYASRS